ncbi:FG-GAP repeat protein [Undibacterium umbellatum]|uniref:FG-GAP repeat protein n=1 Tax=Undibacterium umbellatum TaxID=2762300 RepID=A0ABR6ZID9_9BURK|nr:FG-GAP repeat protein [Undibacterium umbellatum]MBC3911444.1 FG-GAP repeat protein [Undibacterium umbellatum]
MKNFRPFLLLLSVSLFASVSHAADMEVGTLLMSGEWRQDVGSYGVPKQFEKILPAKWPGDQWVSLDLKENSLEIRPASSKEKMPDWLKKITAQIPTKDHPSNFELETMDESDGLQYLRVPGVQFKPGKHPIYVFKNGTGILQPQLDYQYRLELNGVQFGMRVQNGLKGKNGAAYGEGATYFIEYDGKKFEYALGYFGWDSRVGAISDIDGDGFPDFIIAINGSNSSGRFVLLSSTAKPGKNAPTASLHNWGC